MQYDTSSELLQQLFEACNEGDQSATQLADRTEIEPLRDFLQESARQYRRAADDIRTVGHIDASRLGARKPGPHAVPTEADPVDVVAAWERAECEALTYFRDAYDGPLAGPVAETVKRHFEAGVARLERLRKLQSQPD